MSPLILPLFLLCSAFLSVHGCPPHELNALLTFKSTVDYDDGGMLESWTGHDCCQWRGIKCYATQEGRHVSKLDLRGFGLYSVSRNIYSSLFEFKHLKYLDLNGNLFTGEIPSQFGMLSSLRHLDIPLHCDFMFPGILKDDFCLSFNLTGSSLLWLSNLSSFEYLSLSGVEVSDKSWGSIIGSLRHLKHLALIHFSLPAPTIPTALLNLSSLTFLRLSNFPFHLSNNSISEIPTWMRKLSNLTHLDLSGNSISYIPTWIGKLSSLTHLDLSSNNISGSIPDTIENLTGLEYLELALNALTGQIPSTLSLLINLTRLSLEGNQLRGNIPASLGNLYNLRELELGYNQLRDNIPASLSNLHNLRALGLQDNQLRGNIPASLGNLHNLEVLSLQDNQFSGSLPPSVFHLSSLSVLDVSDNHLNGSIPSVSMLPSSLQWLNLSNNMMNGTITEVFFHKSLKLESLSMSYSGLRINFSSTWIPCFQLLFLQLNNCQIGGLIPSWISTQFDLLFLDLSANQLMGNLPSWLWDIAQLDLSDNHLQGSFTPRAGPLAYLDLSKNELRGPLPGDIHMLLSNVEVLVLADNKFEGEIPTSIANIPDLFYLDVSINCLTGYIPAILANLTHLQALNLEDNSLEREIPKELGSLSDLLSLRIGKNSLQGVLPSSLRNLSNLQVLDVAENNLTGNIPKWIADFSSLHVLVMRSNNFRGKLLPDIGKMPQLQVLDLSCNCFYGTIPHSYLRFPAIQNSTADGGHLQISNSAFMYSESIDLIVKGIEVHYEHILSAFTSIDLSNNRLGGPLPLEIENLKGLMCLNLSMNSLSGPIPDSLGNLVELESVDLSSNNFSGRIPSSLGNLDYLGYLDLSNNSLSGSIPWQGHLVTFEERSFRGNPNLWGCPLERNCSRPIARAAPPPAGGVGEEEKEKGFEFPWYWMCVGLAVGVGFAAVVMVFELKRRWQKKCFEKMDRIIEMLPMPQP